MTFEDYAAIKAVNFSTLKELRRSPLHYQYRRQQPRQDADPLRLGRALHCAVLTPDQLALDFVVWKGGRRYGKEWDSFCEAHATETILTVDQYERACAIRDAVRASPPAREYLERGQPEQTITWTDPATQIRCKARLDWIGESRPALVDIKTARQIEERAFAATVFRYGYHVQLAFYARGLKAARGLDLRPTLIALESEPPHDLAVYELDEDALYAGDEEVSDLLTRLAECEASGAWPGRYTTVQTLSLPRWAFPDEDEGFDALVAMSERVLMED